MKLLISSWIDGTKGLGNSLNLPYNYELIFCGSQERFSRSILEKKNILPKIFEILLMYVLIHKIINLL